MPLYTPSSGAGTPVAGPGTLTGASVTFDGVIRAGYRYSLYLNDMNGSQAASVQFTGRASNADSGAAITIATLADGAERASAVVEIWRSSSANHTAVKSQSGKGGSNTSTAIQTNYATALDGGKISVSAGTFDTGDYVLREYPL